MSTQVNTQDQNEKVQSLESEAGAFKGGPHLASSSVLTTSLLSALQTPSGAVSSDDSILSFILSEDEAQTLLKTQAKQEFNLSQLSNKETDSKSSLGASPKGGTSKKNAIAESAELMSLLQNKAQKSLATELAQEEKVLQDELAAAQKEEALWEHFAKDWKDYQDNPNNTNFQKLMKDLEGIYGRNSQKGKEAASEAEKAQHAWDAEQHWKNESGWDRFISGKWWDPNDWNDFRNGADKDVEKLVGLAASNPGMFSLALDNMNQMIKNHVKDLTIQLQFLQVIEEIVSGGGNAVVQMQSLMNVMMQMGISNNEQSTSRNQIMNNFNIMEMNQKSKQIDKQLKKIHDSENSGGLFGFLKHLFEAIIKIITDPASVFEGIADEVKAIVKDFKEGKIGEAFEKILVDVVLTALTGGADLAFLGTQFGKDMQNMVKLVVDTVVAVVVSLGELMAAAVDKIDGNDSLRKSALSKAGDIWTKVVENPELQTVLQIVMVVIIAAAVMSGQFYLAAFMAVLFVLSTSGALSKMTNAIAKSLGNSAVDKVIADVITIVVITVLSLGVGFAGAADAAIDTASNALKQAAETIAESAENETEAIAEEGINGATNAAQNESKSIGSRVGETIKSAGKKIGPKGGTALTGFGTSLLDTNFGYNLADAFAKGKDKKKWEMILEIINDVIGALAAAGGGLGMAVSGIGQSVDSSVSNGFKKLLPKLAQYFENNSGAFAEFASTLQKTALGIGGIASIETGISQYEQGKMYKELQEFMAQMNELNVSSDDLTRGMQNLTSQFKALSKEQGEINKNAYAAVAPGVEGEIRSLMGQV